MKEEIVNLPHVLADPYSITMHLIARYEEISDYNAGSEDDLGRGSFLGIAQARYPLTDMTDRRYRELIDLNIPEKTNTSLDELLELPTSEYRSIVKLFRKQANEKRKLMEKTNREVNKAQGLIDKAKRNQLT